MLSRERFERSVVGQFHDFGNFSLQNTLNFTMLTPDNHFIETQGKLEAA